MRRRVVAVLVLGGPVLVVLALVFLGGRDPNTQTAVAPVATEAAPQWRPRLVVGTADGRPLHGEPPYSARLTADFYDSPIKIAPS